MVRAFTLLPKASQNDFCVQAKSRVGGLTFDVSDIIADPNKGSVLYSGVDLKSLNVRWYRDQIGYVGQEPTLFNDTIANNIAYGAPNASRQEIEEAARQANAYDFISNFPEGFDVSYIATMVCSISNCPLTFVVILLVKW